MFNPRMPFEHAIFDLRTLVSILTCRIKLPCDYGYHSLMAYLNYTSFRMLSDYAIFELQVILHASGTCIPVVFDL